MRAINATNAAKTGIAAPVSSGLPVNGSADADAFSSLIQALTDLSGQGSGLGSGQGSGLGSGQGSDSSNAANGGSQDPQSQQPLSSLSTTPADITLSAAAVAVILPVAPAPSGVATSKGGGSDAQGQSPSAAATQPTATASTTPDLSAVALLLAPTTPAIQQPAASSPAQSSAIANQVSLLTPVAAGSPDTVASAGTASGQAAGQPPQPVQQAVPTISAATTAQPASQSGADVATTGATQVPAAPNGPQLIQLPAQTSAPQTTSGPMIPQQQLLIVRAVASSDPIAGGGSVFNPAASKGPAVKTASSGGTTKTGATASPALAIAPTRAQPSMPAVQPPTPAQDAGLGHSAANGLLQAPTQTDGDSKPSTEATAQSSEAHAASGAQPIVTDGSTPQPTAATAGTTPAFVADPSAPAAAAAAGSATSAQGLQATASVSQQDPQTLALASRAAALAASAVAQVNVLIQRAGLSRSSSLTVQLDPAELGRVEVKLKIEKGGPVRASVTADRPQTLDMLRNDKASLERALQSAGLNTNSGSLSFNLRSNGNSGQQAGAGGNGQGSGTAADDTSTITTQLAVVNTNNGWTEAGRLDLRV